MKKKRGMACVKCRGWAEPVRTTFQGNEIDGWKCTSCGEVYYYPGRAQRILMLHTLKHEVMETKLSLGRKKKQKKRI